MILRASAYKVTGNVNFMVPGSWAFAKNIGPAQENLCMQFLLTLGCPEVIARVGIAQDISI